MGKVMSTLLRPVKRFNIENRAQKIISQDKPTAAPRHEINKKALELVAEGRTEFLEKHNKKDTKLDGFLKEVYVTSNEAEIVERHPTNPNRPLPQRRNTAETPEWGVEIPDNVPPGKCTLRQAVELLTKYNVEPAKHTAADLASEYKLNADTTANILRYYRILKLYTPPVKNEHKIDKLMRRQTAKDLEDEERKLLGQNKR